MTLNKRITSYSIFYISFFLKSIFKMATAGDKFLIKKNLNRAYFCDTVLSTEKRIKSAVMGGKEITKYKEIIYAQIPAFC